MSENQISMLWLEVIENERERKGKIDQMGSHL